MEYFKNLLGLKKEEEEELKKEIAKGKGKGVVLVHPFWDMKKAWHYFVYADYKKGLKNLFKRNEPIILLEEPKNLRHALKSIKNLGGNGKIYVVPTNLETGEVLHEWEPLIEKMKSLNIRKVHLGGRTLGYVPSHEADLSIVSRENIMAIKEHEDKWLSERYKKSMMVPAKGCIGETYYQLVKGRQFEKVRLMPNLCSPEKRPKA